MVADPRRYTGDGATPPTIKPPHVPPSSTLTLTAPYTLGAGGILYFTSNVGIYEDGTGLLTNDGLIQVISSASFDVTGIADGEENPTQHTFINGRTGVLSVEATAQGTSAYGYNSGSNPVQIQNSGVIQAVSLAGDAYGSYDYGGYYGASFTNSRSGLVAVWASGQGYGLYYYQTGVDFNNSGLIYVTAGSAVGVDGANAFTNSGRIYARDISPGGDSIAVVMPSEAFLYGGSGTFSNSGLISAKTAFLYEEEVSPPYPSKPVIENTGRIFGTIDLSQNVGNSTITNTGLIIGRITFGSGDNNFNGSAGTQRGGIYLGSGTNTVQLGDDGESVYGATTGGADTITGGSGNDSIEIYAGNNVVNGGGGVNTLSFAGAANGANVNLAKGIASCNGTDQIANITQVIGARFFANTLVAGSAGVEFVGGDRQDTLTGGSGDDTLVSGHGGGTATGGGGNNLFVFSAGDHHLTITDFRQNGDDDTLDIYGYSSAESITQSGADTLITLSIRDTVDLKNTNASTLDIGAVVFIPNGHFPPPGATAAKFAVAAASLEWDSGSASGGGHSQAAAAPATVLARPI